MLLCKSIKCTLITHQRLGDKPATIPHNQVTDTHAIPVVIGYNGRTQERLGKQCIRN